MNELEKMVEHLNDHANDLLTQEAITEKDYDFIKDIKGNKEFSFDQIEWINDIWEKAI